VITRQTHLSGTSFQATLIPLIYSCRDLNGPGSGPRIRAGWARERDALRGIDARVLTAQDQCPRYGYQGMSLARPSRWPIVPPVAAPVTGGGPIKATTWCRGGRPTSEQERASETAVHGLTAFARREWPELTDLSQAGVLSRPAVMVGSDAAYCNTTVDTGLCVVGTRL